MINKNPRMIMKIGDMRALVQRTVPEFLDESGRDLVNRTLGGDLPDMFQVVQAVYTEYDEEKGKTYTRRKPSIWFTAKGQYCEDNIAFIKEIFTKFRKGLPLLIEARYGTYKLAHYGAK